MCTLQHFHQMVFHSFSLSDVRGQGRDSRSCLLNLPPGRRVSWKQPWMLVRKGQLTFFVNLLPQFYGLRDLNSSNIIHSSHCPNSVWSLPPIVAGCSAAAEKQQQWGSCANTVGTWHTCRNIVVNQSLVFSLLQR